MISNDADQMASKQIRIYHILQKEASINNQLINQYLNNIPASPLHQNILDILYLNRNKNNSIIIKSLYMIKSKTAKIHSKEIGRKYNSIVVGHRVKNKVIRKKNTKKRVSRVNSEDQGRVTHAIPNFAIQFRGKLDNLNLGKMYQLSLYPGKHRNQVSELIAIFNNISVLQNSTTKEQARKEFQALAGKKIRQRESKEQRKEFHKKCAIILIKIKRIGQEIMALNRKLTQGQIQKYLSEFIKLKTNNKPGEAYQEKKHMEGKRIIMNEVKLDKIRIDSRHQQNGQNTQQFDKPHEFSAFRQRTRIDKTNIKEKQNAEQEDGNNQQSWWKYLTLNQKKRQQIQKDSQDIQQSSYRIQSSKKLLDEDVR